MHISPTQEKEDMLMLVAEAPAGHSFYGLGLCAVFFFLYLGRVVFLMNNMLILQLYNYSLL